MKVELRVLSQESAKKIIDSGTILRRQERVMDVFREIDKMKLIELEDVSLVKEIELLPADSSPRELMDAKLDELPTAYHGLKPSKATMGGAIGTAIGGIVGLLVARTAKDRNYVGWAGLGGAMGGAIGALIGSLWDIGG
jgi:hypothetical protein